jgi:hypothetical protein
MALAQTFNGGQFAAVSQYDPQVKSLLEEMRKAATTAANAQINQLVTSPNSSTLTFLADTKNVNHAPTTSITVNANQKNRIQGSYYWIRFTRVPDNLNGGFPTYPGFPEYGNADQYRTLGSLSLRTTVNTSIVNEARGGWQWAPVGFSTNGNAAQFANQGSHNITSLAGLYTAANGSSASAPNLRNTANMTMADQLNWLHGSHSMTFGADYTHINDYNTLSNPINSLALGLRRASTRRTCIFSAANFPGRPAANETREGPVRTADGRVSSSRRHRPHERCRRRLRLQRHADPARTQDDFSFYAQDSWRWKPTLTITAGLRYQFTLPVNSAVGNFTPMTMSDACGRLGPGRGSRRPDRATCSNPGDTSQPHRRAACTTCTRRHQGLRDRHQQSGAERRRGVAAEQAGRRVAGRSWAIRNGDGQRRLHPQLRPAAARSVPQRLQWQPGQTIPLTRSTTTGAFPLVLPGESWPILYGEKTGWVRRRSIPPCFPDRRVIRQRRVDVRPEDPASYVDSWNVSFHRSVTRDTVVELRIRATGPGDRGRSRTGTISTCMRRAGWTSARVWAPPTSANSSSRNRNLRANVLSGDPARAGSFAYFGPGTGTSPLPIVLAHSTPPKAATSPPPTRVRSGRAARSSDRSIPYNASPRTFVQKPLSEHAVNGPGRA